MSSLFAFTQFEFGFPLGPPDGRFVVRDRPHADPRAVLVLSTLDAPRRQGLRARRRGRSVATASPEPVPTSRATVVAAEPFADEPRARGWLAGLRAGGADAQRAGALRLLNRALHAHRVAHADPHARDVAADHALVTRIGFGAGDDVVDGRYADAWELPAAARRVRRSMEAPEERFTALLGARERVAACEELTLRARMDLDAGRDREAALQARVALEAALAELRDELPGDSRAELEADRRAIGDAANTALAGDLPPAASDALRASVERIESALRVRRLRSWA